MLKAILNASIFGYTWKLRGFVFLITLSFIVIGFFAGWGLDSLIGWDKRLMTALGVLISFPFTQVFLSLFLKKWSGVRLGQR